MGVSAAKIEKRTLDMSDIEFIDKRVAGSN
jgi:hypothetical protein